MVKRTFFVMVVMVCCCVVSLSAIFDVTVVVKKDIINCHTGNDITKVEGNSNTVQVVRAGCDSRIGSTAQTVRFLPEELPLRYSTVRTTKGTNQVTMSVPQEEKIVGYKVTRAQEGDQTTTLLLQFVSTEAGSQLITYTSMPWAGQPANTWSRGFVIPFNVPLEKLAGSSVLLQFESDGFCTIIIGDPIRESLQFRINLFNPFAI